ncbi:MAG: QueT transporter family protein [Holdemania massiliensis]
MKNKTLVRFCISAVIAALYALLALAPLSFGPIQIRIAEAMTLLPILFQRRLPA